MMRQYERNRVTVDQCTECRGIFLDRGELEHLMDAEAAFNNPQGAPVAPPAAPAPAPQYREERRYDDRRYDDRRHHDDHYRRDDYYYKKKKKRSLFSELFDD